MRRYIAARRLAADCHLTSEDGNTFVIKAGPTHEVPGTNSLDEPVLSSPAIAVGNIFIRGERDLYCIGK